MNSYPGSVRSPESIHSDVSVILSEAKNLVQSVFSVILSVFSVILSEAKNLGRKAGQDPGAVLQILHSA